MHKATATSRRRFSGAWSSNFLCITCLCWWKHKRQMLRLCNLSLNAAGLHAKTRVSAAPLIISYISPCSSAPRQGHFLPMRQEKCLLFVLACSLKKKISSRFIHLFIYFFCSHLIWVKIQIRARQWKSFQTSESEQFASAPTRARLIGIHEAKARWMPSLALSRLRTRLCDQGSQRLDGSSLTVTSPLTCCGERSRSAARHAHRVSRRGAGNGKSVHEWVKLQSAWAEIALWFHITSAARVWRVAQTITIANGAAFKAAVRSNFNRMVSMVIYRWWYNESWDLRPWNLRNMSFFSKICSMSFNVHITRKHVFLLVKTANQQRPEWTGSNKWPLY